MTYWLYRAIARLPLWMCYPIATAAAWLAQYVLRYRRQIILNNLVGAFPEHSHAWRKQRLSEFYSGLADTTIEIIFGSRMSLEEISARVHYENPEVVRIATDNFTRPALVLTLHQGNWEWMLRGAKAALNIRVDPVYKKLRSPGADRFALETRSQFGAKPILMKHVARNVLKHRAEARLIALVADQSPGKRERVHWTTFLNQSTAFFSGGAAIARATGLPVIFATCQRVSRGYYNVRFEVITGTPKELPEDEIIERYTQLAEREIRRHPASWLWSNNRWKRSKPLPATQLAAATPAIAGSDKSNQENPSP